MSEEPPWARRHREVLAPLVCGAALRVGLLVVACARTGTRVLTQGDTLSYVGPGRNLFATGVYGSGGVAEIDRTPGYPVFLMLTGMMHGHVLLTACAQIAVSLVSLLLVRWIAERVFASREASLLAAWFYAVEPSSIVYSVRLMPETLFVALMLGAMTALMSYFAAGRLRAVAIAGVLLAAATYVRPVSYYLVIPLAGLLAFAAKGKRSQWWKAPAVLLLATLPWLALWQARNWAEAGYGGYSAIVEKNLYFYQSAEVTAELEHLPLADVQARRGYLDEASYVAAHPEQAGWRQAERLKFMRGQAMAILRTNRGLYLRTHWVGVGIVAFTPCATELLQLVGAYPDDAAMPKRMVNEGVWQSLALIAQWPGVAATMVALEAWLVLLYALALWGVLRGGGDWKAIALLGGIAMYFLLISGGAQAVGRYRVPMMPEICVLAAGGLAAAMRAWRHRKSGAAAAPLSSSARFG